MWSQSGLNRGEKSPDSMMNLETHLDTTLDSAFQILFEV